MMGAALIAAALSGGGSVTASILGTASLDGMNPDGWVAALSFADMALGQTLDPTKITGLITGPGYDAAGAATLVTRAVTATAHLRKAFPEGWVAATVYPAGAVCSRAVGSNTYVYSTAAGGTSGATAPTHTTGTVSDGGVAWTFVSDGAFYTPEKQETSVDGAAVVYAVLSDTVFVGETVTLNVAAGAYGASSASTGVSVTNGSTRASFRPHLAWVLQPYQLVTSTLHVEATATHPFGRNLRTLACMKFIVVDATGTPVSPAVSATVTEMTASTVLTAGKPVPVFAADLDVSGLAKGSYGVIAEAYPFVGSATYKTLVDGFGPSTVAVANKLTANTPKVMPFYRDDGTYGRIYAYVDPALASGGTASTSEATAAASPFPTIVAAHTAIRALSNTTFGRNNAANHVIRLLAGTYPNGWAGTSQNTTTLGEVMLTLEPAPGVDPTTIIWNSPTAVSGGARRMVYRNLRFTRDSTNAPVDNQVGTAVNGTMPYESWFEGCTITSSTGALAMSRLGLAWFANCTLNMVGSGFGTGNNTSGCGLLGGCTISGGTIGWIHALGNIWSGGNRAKPNLSNLAEATPDGSICGYNAWTNAKSTLKFPEQGEVITGGIGFIQNLRETTDTLAKGIECSADGSVTAIDNVHFMFNTVPGDGINFLYNENGPAEKYGVLKGNVVKDRNVKADFYDSGAIRADGSRVGNMAVRYMVGAALNFVYAPESSVPSQQNLIGEVTEATSRVEVFDPGFTDDKSGAAGTGGGDYQPTNVSTLCNRMAVNANMLPFDLNGVTRRNDGTGAPGAYERAA